MKERYKKQFQEARFDSLDTLKIKIIAAMRAQRIAKQDPRYIYSDERKKFEKFWDKIYDELDRQKKILNDIHYLMSITVNDDLEEEIKKYE
jgi:cobalamin biosynthesis protein CbiG